MSGRGRGSEASPSSPFVDAEDDEDSDNPARHPREKTVSTLSGTDRTNDGGAMDGDPSHPTAAASNNTNSREAHNKYIIGFLKIFGATVISSFFIIPALIIVYPGIIRDLAFMNHIQWPPFVNLSNPEAVGLSATRNFYFDTAPEVTVGAWHILPYELGSEVSSSSGEAEYIKLLQNGSPIILYLHGNAGTRASWHRVELYKVLSKTGFHVLTFDYRGYGDSTGFPSEEGIVEDSISAFRWIRRQTNESAIFIWGHSLGSAVATGTAKRLDQAGERLDGLVLESPFNNFAEAAFSHPLAIPFKMFPWISWILIDGIKSTNICFASDENIAGVTAKTLILHALDDGVVPYALALKLYNAALQTKKGSVEFVTFDEHHDYGHKHIHKAPDLPDIIRGFTQPLTAKADQ